MVERFIKGLIDVIRSVLAIDEFIKEFEELGIVDIEDRCLRLRGGMIEREDVRAWQTGKRLPGRMDWNKYVNYNSILRQAAQERNRAKWMFQQGYYDFRSYNKALEEISKEYSNRKKQFARASAMNADLDRKNKILAGLTSAYGITNLVKGIREHTIRRIRTRANKGGDQPPFKKQNAGGDVINDNIEPLRIMELRSGKEVLETKFRGLRMYTSKLTYNMSLVLYGISATHHYLGKGQGPHLYTTYNNTKNDGTMRENNFNQPVASDADFGTGDKGVGLNSTCYVFAADWPFMRMNHDAATISTVGKKLEWRYSDIDATTDPNLPLQVNDFITNKDWNYMKVYGVEYTFDFTNNDVRPYCVEILLFKFKADPDAMDYLEQVHAPYRNQPDRFMDYCNYPNYNFNPTDITVLQRKRIYIRGCELSYYDGSNWGNMPRGASNTAKYKMKVNRKYIMKRPILGAYTTLDENEFFDDYYEPHKGIYCRVQAWPMSLQFSTHFTAGAINANSYNYADTVNKAPPTTLGSTLGVGLDIRICKKGKFKFDETRIKTLS